MWTRRRAIDRKQACLPAPWSNCRALVILWRFPLNAELITATNADHACGGPTCKRDQSEQVAKRCAQQCQHSCIPIALVCFAGMLICGLRLGRGWAACGLILHGAPWCSIYTCALICNAMTLQEGCKCLGASQRGAAMSCWRDLVDLVPNAMSSQLQLHAKVPAAGASCSGCASQLILTSEVLTGCDAAQPMADAANVPQHLLVLSVAQLRGAWLSMAQATVKDWLP